MKRSLATIAILCFSLSLLIAEPAVNPAIAIVIGEVSLNGNSIIRSCPVLNGDYIKTGPNAAVILHAKGVSLQIGPGSEIRYQGQELKLLSGSAQVRGVENISSGPFIVSPAASTQFEVQRIEKRLVITLTHGTLKIARGKQTTTLTAAGKYLLQDDEPLPSLRERHMAAKSGVIAAGSGTGVIISHWLTGGRSGAAHPPDTPGQPVSNQSPAAD